MCESFLEVTIEVRIPFTRTIIVPTEQIERGIEMALTDFPGITLNEGCQDYAEGKPELVINQVTTHR